MAIQKAKTNKPFIRYGGASTVNIRNSGNVTIDRFASAYFDNAGQSALYDYKSPSWGNGTGTLAGTTGVIVFNSSVVGFGLESVSISNRGTNVAYIGFNSEVPVLGSGFLLPTGSTVQYDDTKIDRIWAITAANTTVIAGQGLPKYIDTGN